MSDSQIYKEQYSEQKVMSSVLGRKCIEQKMLHPHQDINLLNCVICLEVMSYPVRVNCSQSSEHVFGSACIQQWIKTSEKKECPLCRGPFTQISLNYNLMSKLNHIQTNCPHCDQILPANELHSHVTQCSRYREKRLKQLKEIIQKQKYIIFGSIDPHLRYSHKQIHDQYVKEWQWLQCDERDFKWWWMVQNPWWNGQKCQLCKDLWYRDRYEIEELERKRIQIIKQIKRVPGTSSE